MEHLAALEDQLAQLLVDAVGQQRQVDHLLETRQDAQEMSPLEVVVKVLVGEVDL